jgi:regulator of replication initiation timing
MIDDTLIALEQKVINLQQQLEHTNKILGDVTQQRDNFKTQVESIANLAKENEDLSKKLQD